MCLNAEGTGHPVFGSGSDKDLQECKLLVKVAAPLWRRFEVES